MIQATLFFPILFKTKGVSDMKARTFKVYISSTHDDMKAECTAAYEALVTSGNIVSGNGYLSEETIGNFGVIQRDIETSDIFILILGGRYGSICPETGKSLIHMEYEYALSLKMPIGVIAISDTFLSAKKSSAYSSGSLYDDLDSENYNRLLLSVSHNTISYYSDIHEFTSCLLEKIDRLSADYPINGWIQCKKNNLRSYFSELSDDDLINTSGRTIIKEIITSEKDHYKVSNSLFYDDKEMSKLLDLKTIYLIQRSSSLVLGAEQGWDAESVFLSSLQKAINTCEGFYHIITLEGIENHLKRSGSTFPNFKDFTKHFIEIDGYAAAKKANAPSVTSY